ncbi:MAG TPA: L-threonylcarbamoyladenylate synthase [Candidatus Bathyarchaeia archaeon]|nr:L-threonylcarbamoyladenylate synthase [Candidatus Bathyarchaeia archaeon]
MTRVEPVSDGILREAIQLVRDGGLVAYPTDTVYGLGCDPFNPGAVERLAAVKERSKMLLPILIDNMDTARRLGILSSTAERVANMFWPGVVTLVVPSRVILSMITEESNTIGLRVPGHAFARKLVGECGGALVGTSANISGRPSCKTAEEVLENLDGRIDLIIDGGPAQDKESSVVKIIEDDVTIIREGQIPNEAILRVVRDIVV